MTYSQKFKDALTEWIGHVLKFVNLTEWQIMLLNVPPEGSDAAACINCIYGRKWADLCLASDFFTYDRAHQEHYLLHELCHIICDPVDKAVCHGGLDTVMGKPAYTTFQAGFNIALENVVDNMATAIGDLFADGKEYQRLWNAVIEAEK